MHLFLNGGGDGQAVADARAVLNEVIDHNKKILYIPFAWEDSTYSGCLEFITEELSDVEAAGIEMVRNGKELYEKQFSEYACLYIGGGNTFKLLKMLKDSNCFEKIRDYLTHGGIVWGGSAGAIIFGRDIESCAMDDRNDVGLLDVAGFDMIDGYSLLCHYTNREAERTREATEYLMELSKKKPIYAIPEEDTIYISDGAVEVLGGRQYYVFVDGESCVGKDDIG